MADYTGTITLTDMSTLPIPERNYFWFLTRPEGTCDPGIYVTEIDTNSFKQQKTGAYLYINNGGLNLGVDNTIYTELTTGGLKVKKGGLVGGTVGTNGYVYLSTEAHTGTTVNIGGNSSNWRLIVGTKFGVTGAGDLYATNANISGTINATLGNIGGWTITSGKIYGGDGSSVKTAVMQLPSSNTTWVFAAGGSSHSSYADCPFRVSKTGELYATNANIGGTITATGGKVGNLNVTSVSLYTGDHSSWDSNVNGIFINDTIISFGKQAITYFKNDGTGKIGPWYITSTSIYKGSATYGASGTGNMYFGNSGLSINNTFKVSNAGALTATGANISGTITTSNITATGGTIGGWIIDSSRIKGFSDGNGNLVNSESQALRYAVMVRAGADGNVAFGVGRRDSTSDSWTWASYMNYRGDLVSTRATITGSITATSFIAKANNVKRAEVTTDGLKIYNSSGTLISTFGNSITLASNGATVNIGSTASGNVNMQITTTGLYFNYADKDIGRLYCNYYSSYTDSRTSVALFSRGALHLTSTTRLYINGGTDIDISTPGNIYMGAGDDNTAKLYMQGCIYLADQSSGSYRNVLGYTSANNNNLVLGSYQYASGNSGYNTYVEGYNVYIRSNGGTCYVKQNTASNTAITSDIRLKTNIKSLDNKIQDLFMELNPVEFNWINIPNSKKSMGLIAQEVEETYEKHGFKNYGIVGEFEYPDRDEQFKKGANKFYKSLSYNDFIPMCIYMIQKQQLEIEELKQQLKGGIK